MKRFYMCVLVLFLLGFSGQVFGETFEVTTTVDGVEGSLRAAIDSANGNEESDTINVPAGIYYLTGTAGEDANAGGDLDISGEYGLTITGAGASTTIIDGNGNDRVLHILVELNVNISDVTIRNGKTADGAVGVNNAKGAPGGGIYSNGNLTLTDCIITGNSTGAGGFYSNEELEDGEGGNGGNGGGICNTFILELRRCTVSNNSTGIGGGYDFMGGSGGADGGFGGGIYSNSTISSSNFAIFDTIISGNATGSGGFEEPWGGSGGKGGGIYCSESTIAHFNQLTIDSNVCGDGYSYLANVGGNGGGGGGIYNEGSIMMFNSTISNNASGNAGDGEPLSIGAGPGGGFYNSGSFTLRSSTISSNSTGNGGTCNSNYVYCHGGNGGGFYNDGYECAIENSTVTNNTTGAKGSTGVSLGGCGGGFYATATVDIRNSILAGNTTATGGIGPDGNGTLDSQGYNLIQDATGCTITGSLTGNLTGVDPLLGPLADNGGLTYTHALLTGSPAIDAGFNESTTDQRDFGIPIDVDGVANVVDGADIGAFEFGAYAVPIITLNRTQLTFAAVEGVVTPPQTFIINISGEGSLDWQLTNFSGWAGCTPPLGTGYGVVTVTVDPTGLAPGTYTDKIYVSGLEPRVEVKQVDLTLTVYSADSTAVPFGVFSTPLEGAAVSGSIPVTGWVLDDLGVQNVTIYSGETYLGDATFVEGARPDVETAYPGYPQNNKAGWGYMLLTNFLPDGGNGSYTLNAWATDMENNKVLLGSKTITVNNAGAVKPFGAIDTPEQGGPAAGSHYINYGWALTPMPNTIPFDGSSITVYVDGVDVGHPVYNQNREDLAALFPGYNNSNGAVGYLTLDTTQLSNGIHTIAWSVSDDAGNNDGIGSRYFMVQNTGSLIMTGTPRGSSIKGTMLPGPVVNNAPVDINGVTGWGNNTLPLVVELGTNGGSVVSINEIGRLVINSCVSAELMVGNRSKGLPVGAGLDRSKEIFSWQPGPGFDGDYRLMLYLNDSNKSISKKIITVRIHPTASRL
ncbi:MAG: hypothetical protein GY757_46765 [bacterium]|nr:hypothetical protein [bacterium]